MINQIQSQNKVNSYKEIRKFNQKCDQDIKYFTNEFISDENSKLKLIIMKHKNKFKLKNIANENQRHESLNLEKIFSPDNKKIPKKHSILALVLKNKSKKIIF